MSYPSVLSERETLSRLSSQSIARFGDGELRCALGGGCTSQTPDPRLATELRRMLMAPQNCLIGIPNATAGPKIANWAKYATPQFTSLYGAPEYASAFITRPDSAPTIDTPDYWAGVEALWTGKDITLVVGDKKSLTSEMMTTAASIREGCRPRQHAYAHIHRHDEEVRTHSGTVNLCLDPTATALAYRLAQKGVHALDLGHLGMFKRHAGLYRYVLDDLVTPAYRKQLNTIHEGQRWGADGHKHVAAVRAFANMIEPATILDYGCGKGTLAPAMPERRIQMYDPGIPGREGSPKPVDMIVCTDVLEHVEPERLDSVLAHISVLASKAAYVVVATRPANLILPDGRNAHLVLRPFAWWAERFVEHGWTIAESADRKGKDAVFWLRK